MEKIKGKKSSDFTVCKVIKPIKPEKKDRGKLICTIRFVEGEVPTTRIITKDKEKAKKIIKELAENL